MLAETWRVIAAPVAGTLFGKVSVELNPAGNVPSVMLGTAEDPDASAVTLTWKLDEVETVISPGDVRNVRIDGVPPPPPPPGVGPPPPQPLKIPSKIMPSETRAIAVQDRTLCRAAHIGKASNDKNIGFLGSIQIQSRWLEIVAESEGFGKGE
jgi:hypothetical protein